MTDQTENQTHAGRSTKPGRRRIAGVALAAIFSAPTIDRAALEQARAGEIAKLGKVSRTMTTSLADAGDVLIPEQTAKLATLVAERHTP